MEKAVFITNTRYLDAITREYSRVYFGTEFCQRRIPSEQDMDEAVEAAAASGAGFTLVTPYVTDAGLEKVELLCRRLSASKERCEVVVNDWGVLRMVHSRFPNIIPVLGRLLVKQKRCPTLIRLLQRKVEAAMIVQAGGNSPQRLGVQTKLPRSLDWYYKGSNAASVPVLQQYLQQCGVSRIELDNLGQGMRVSLPAKGLSASVYVPFVYISTTFYCLTAGCDSGKESVDKRRPCSQECQRYVFRLRHASMPRDILLKGNTQFYRNEKISYAAWEKKGIDRVVFAPLVPV